MSVGDDCFIVAKRFTCAHFNTKTEWKVSAHAYVATISDEQRTEGIFLTCVQRGFRTVSERLCRPSEKASPNRTTVYVFIRRAFLYTLETVDDGDESTSWLATS
jgi:hypothetical protein